MANWKSPRQKAIVLAIERWRDTASEEVDDIGGWRDAEPSDRYHRYWTGQRPNPPVTAMDSSIPNRFYTDTSYLISLITSRFEKLDPNPLMDVYTAVEAWHTDHNAERIPAHPDLCTALDQAMFVLQAVSATVLELHFEEDISDQADESDLPLPKQADLDAVEKIIARMGNSNPQIKSYYEENPSKLASMRV